VAADAAGLPVFTPRSLRDPAVLAALRQHAADAFVVAAYGKLLPAEVLGMPRLGVLNVHPSLLPKYRGPSPVQQAILDGVSESGVSVMLLDEGMDTGPVLAQERVRLRGDETGGALTAALFERGAALLVETLEKWATGEVRPVAQDESQATVTKLLAREDGQVDWTRPAEQIARMVRAYDPWPGTHTTWNGKVLKVLAAAASDEAAGPPGAVSMRDGGLVVGTGRGALVIARLQLEGRREATAVEFVRGYPGIAGAALPG
jgi:methionyl-tRNA formyltransferase